MGIEDGAINYKASRKDRPPQTHPVSEDGIAQD